MGIAIDNQTFENLQHDESIKSLFTDYLQLMNRAEDIDQEKAPVYGTVLTKTKADGLTIEQSQSKKIKNIFKASFKEWLFSPFLYSTSALAYNIAEERYIGAAQSFMNAYSAIQQMAEIPLDDFHKAILEEFISVFKLYNEDLNYTPDQYVIPSKSINISLVELSEKKSINLRDLQLAAEQLHRFEVVLYINDQKLILNEEIEVSTY